MTTPALDLQGVTFVRDARTILDDVSLTVQRGEQWALIGPNGAGKSTLLNHCGAVTFPSRGTVDVLGSRLGRVDVRDLRRSIGFVGPRHPLSSNLPVLDVVLTGATGTIERIPRWEPTAAESERAALLMKTVGVEGISSGPGSTPLRWHTMSQGERGRALIARALMTDPPLLLLDEPSTGLDVAAREQLMQILADLPTRIPGLTTVMVTHHFEELPVSTSHAALLRGGRVVAAGPVEAVLTTELVTRAFAHPIQVTRVDGRWSARA